jgi:hypothetical protein
VPDVLTLAPRFDVSDTDIFEGICELLLDERARSYDATFMTPHIFIRFTSTENFDKFLNVKLLDTNKDSMPVFVFENDQAKFFDTGSWTPHIIELLRDIVHTKKQYEDKKKAIALDKATNIRNHYNNLFKKKP